MINLEELNKGVNDLIAEAEKLVKAMDGISEVIKELEKSLISLDIRTQYSYVIAIESTGYSFNKCKKVLAWDNNPGQRKGTYRLMYQEITYTYDPKDEKTIQEIIDIKERPLLEWNISVRSHVYPEIQSFINGFEQYLEDYIRKINLTNFHIKI